MHLIYEPQKWQDTSEVRIINFGNIGNQKYLFIHKKNSGKHIFVIEQKGCLSQSMLWFMSHACNVNLEN